MSERTSEGELKKRLIEACVYGNSIADFDKILDEVRREFNQLISESAAIPDYHRWFLKWLGTKSP
jgi:hypothetical protein